MTEIERIAVNPGIHFGKPCVAGTRITVQSVLELINDGLTFDEIIQTYYPDLTTEDIHACLDHALCNPPVDRPCLSSSKKSLS